MKDSARLLQERLEQLEAGQPLDACLADLPEDEADLLKIATMLRQVQFPERNDNVVAAQRANLLKLAARQKSVKDRPSQGLLKTLLPSRSNRLLPLAALAGAVALLFLCVLVAVIGAGLAWRSHRHTDLAQNPSPSPTVPILVGRPSPSPTSAIVAQNPSPAPSPTPKARPVQNPPAEPTKASGYDVFVPLVSQPDIRNPQRAALKDPQGLVQVQASDGTWTAISARRTITAGQRIRTGALSTARLAFYDGSQAHLGPNTEVSVDKLDARTSGGPRVVVLTQWVGETNHDVVPSDDAGSRYEVRTPSATGEARGTSFHVLVASLQLTRFSVDEGSVAVTGLDVTVVVVAGQATTISPGEPPSEPVFRITGEGQVTQSGTAWIVAGQTFEIDENAVIVGHPQVGDWVFVEGRLLPDGTRLADRIVLLRRSPENRFTITGRVDAISDTAWTVAGQTVRVNDQTSIDDDIETGDVVSVEGVILESGTLLAEEIRLVEEKPGLPFHFVGVVQSIAAETWTISGIAVTVDADTDVDQGLVPADIVQVRGWILDDGTWLARSIERVEEGDRAFEFTGYVESIGPWVVSGIAFETREWTEIEPGIGLGDRVKVTGRILEDGAWVASEIERLDQDDDALYVVFVGRVTSIGPWVVGGIPLVVDDETIIQGEVDVGDLVKVKARILDDDDDDDRYDDGRDDDDPDGTWLAVKIRRIDIGLGCYRVRAVVVRVDARKIAFENWPTVDLDDGIVIEGDIDVNSVVLIFVCVDADGTPKVVRIVVIYKSRKVIILPPPPPPPPPPADDDGGKVTICHKPGSKGGHTITISRSALQSHLEHGDHIGPCSDRGDDDHDDDDDRDRQGHDDDDDDDDHDDDHDDDDRDDDDNDDDHDDDDHD